MQSRLRVLVVTKIYPSSIEPTSAQFNRQQIGALSRLCDLELLATIPWYPGAGLFARGSSAGRLTSVPRVETIDGLRVQHPRTLFIPKVAHSLWAPLYAASLAPLALKYRGAIDVLLGTWAYPDGVAAVMLAKLIGVPAVVKLHGSDINVIGKMPGPRRLLSVILPKAKRVVAVSRALAAEARELGVPEDRLAIVMNGVDTDLFKPADRAAARAQLGLDRDPKRRIVLYVGNLKESKGVLDLLAAFERVSKENTDVQLAIVGGGEAKGAVEAAASRLSPDRVVVAGARPLDEVSTWMAACDVLALPSWAEGTPNVVLEALASGRRVVATNVGGIPDLVTDPLLGELVPKQDRDALAAALSRAVMLDYNPSDVATLGARGGWEASARRLLEVLEEASL